MYGWRLWLSSFGSFSSFPVQSILCRRQRSTSGTSFTLLNWLTLLTFVYVTFSLCLCLFLPWLSILSACFLAFIYLYLPPFTFSNACLSLSFVFLSSITLLVFLYLYCLLKPRLLAFLCRGCLTCNYLAYLCYLACLHFPCSHSLSSLAFPLPFLACLNTLFSFLLPFLSLSLICWPILALQLPKLDSHSFSHLSLASSYYNAFAFSFLPIVFIRSLACHQFK